MNIEQTKEAIRIMQAYVDGKEVISMYAPADTADDPYWNWGNDTKMYHIKPTAKLRPWTADEVPLGAWMQVKSDPKFRWLIVNVANDDMRREFFLRNEHSTDKGVTWLPCGVMEEGK
jgi:hypothetical protein